MSDFSDAHDGPVRPLTALKANGEPYTRLEVVEIEIGKMLCLHQSEWLALLEDLKSETLVYLIREVQQGNKELYGGIFYELHRRIPPLAGRWIRDFDPTMTDLILSNLETVIFDLILNPKGTAQTDCLEVAFGQAVKRRAINMAEKYRNDPMARRGEIAEDAHSLPEQEVGEAGRPTLDPELLQKAYEKVKDPEDLKMFKLYYVEGVPIQSSDPEADSLMRRTGAGRGKIQYRLDRTMKIIRKVLGVSE